MTQRRRLDAFLAEQAVAAGAEFRDGVRVEQLEIGDDRVVARVGGEPIAARNARRRRRSERRRREGGGARATGSCAASRSRATSRGHLLDEQAYASTAVVEVGAPCRRLRLALPEGRSCEPRRGRLGERGAAPAAAPRTTRRRYGIEPDAIADLRGHRLPMRRLGASTPAGERVVLVGDAAGLVDPLSGDGMYEAFVSARLAADAILAGDRTAIPPRSRRALDSARRCVVVGQARARPVPRRVLLGGALARRVRRRRRPPPRGRRSPRRGAWPRTPAAAPDRARRASRLTPFAPRLARVKVRGPGADALST